MNSLKDLYQFFDETLERGLSQRGVKLTCAHGCSACCQELVHVTEVEARFILDGMADAEKEDLRGRVHTWVESVNQTSLPEREPRDAHEYRSWRIPCPLLKDGACSVYERRPLSCRGFMTDGPRRSCEILSLRRTQRFIEVPELMNYAVRGLMCLHSTGGSDDVRVAVGHLGFWLAHLLGIDEVEIHDATPEVNRYGLFE